MVAEMFETSERASYFTEMFSACVCLSVSVCLFVCLSVCILRKLSKLSPNHGDLDRLFDFDIQSQVH